MKKVISQIALTAAIFASATGVANAEGLLKIKVESVSTYVNFESTPGKYLQMRGKIRDLGQSFKDEGLERGNKVQLIFRRLDEQQSLVPATEAEREALDNCNKYALRTMQYPDKFQLNIWTGQDTGGTFVEYSEESEVYKIGLNLHGTALSCVIERR